MKKRKTNTQFQKLTPRQEELILFLSHFLKQHGEMPTVQEISEGIQMPSIGNVSNYLTNLERKGYISRRNHYPRSIHFLIRAKKFLRSHEEIE